MASGTSQSSQTLYSMVGRSCPVGIIITRTRFMHCWPGVMIAFVDLKTISALAMKRMFTFTLELDWHLQIQGFSTHALLFMYCNNEFMG